MYYFCSYFDRHYLVRALALYNSLESSGADFHLFALCMDDESHRLLEDLALPRVTLLRLQELEHSNHSLLSRKTGRSKVEYYYTCGPSYILFLLQLYPQIEVINYLDADLFFFSSPKPIFDEIEGYSVGIIEHRFTKRDEKLKRFGIFNVGWMSFRRDECGLACLRWWADQCIEWCYDRLEGNKYADQKYLDEFSVRFNSVRVIQNKGANVAPWNLANYSITEREGCIFVDEQPLIFFHFHGFKVLNSWLFDSNLGGYHASPSKVVRQKIFGRYISELRDLRIYAGPVRSLRETSRYESRGYGLLARGARRAAKLGLGILRRAYIIDFRRDGVVPNG